METRHSSDVLRSQTADIPLHRTGNRRTRCRGQAFPAPVKCRSRRVSRLLPGRLYPSIGIVLTIEGASTGTEPARRARWSGRRATPARASSTAGSRHLVSRRLQRSTKCGRWCAGWRKGTPVPPLCAGLEPGRLGGQPAPGSRGCLARGFTIPGRTPHHTLPHEVDISLCTHSERGPARLRFPYVLHLTEEGARYRGTRQGAAGDPVPEPVTAPVPWLLKTPLPTVRNRNYDCICLSSRNSTRKPTSWVVEVLRGQEVKFDRC